MLVTVIKLMKTYEITLNFMDGTNYNSEDFNNSLIFTFF